MFFFALLGAKRDATAARRERDAAEAAEARRTREESKAAVAAEEKAARRERAEEEAAAALARATGTLYSAESLGAARAAELEAEETHRREETRTEDERLWSSLGDSRSEAQLRRYLDRFPDGAHAQTTRKRYSEYRTISR